MKNKMASAPTKSCGSGSPALEWCWRSGRPWSKYATSFSWVERLAKESTGYTDKSEQTGW